MTCPSPRSFRRVGFLASLFVIAGLAGCGHPGATGIWAASADGISNASASPSVDPSAGPSTNPSAGTSASAGAAARPSASPARTTGAPKPAPVPGVSAAAQAVLDQINGWRGAAGLRPYTMLPGLIASAHKHNLTMSGGCGLSHQCPNEPPFGDRITAQGVHWGSAGENIGESGPIGNNTGAITNAAKGINQSMFNEKPPNDGHRRNLLSKSFTHIGIDVIRDSHGTVWITQDFTN